METLCAWIYSPQRRDRRTSRYLPRGQEKRRRHPGGKVHFERIKSRTSIHYRPAEVCDWVHFRHWESDNVLGMRAISVAHYRGATVPVPARDQATRINREGHLGRTDRVLPGAARPRDRVRDVRQRIGLRVLLPSRRHPGHPDLFRRPLLHLAARHEQAPQQPDSKTSPKKSSTSSSPALITAGTKSPARQPRPTCSKNYAHNGPQPHVALETRIRAGSSEEPARLLTRELSDKEVMRTWNSAPSRLLVTTVGALPGPCHPQFAVEDIQLGCGAPVGARKRPSHSRHRGALQSFCSKALSPHIVLWVLLVFQPRTDEARQYLPQNSSFLNCQLLVVGHTARKPLILHSLSARLSKNSSPESKSSPSPLASCPSAFFSPACQSLLQNHD